MIDTRQQAGKHTIKDKYFEEHGIKIVRSKLPVGDYGCMQDMSVICDSKNSIDELCSDVIQDHERFRRELLLAQDNGIKLYIVVENSVKCLNAKQNIWNPKIRDLKDLHNWKNPRLFVFQHGKQKYPTATRGVTLMKACMTMQQKYGCEFLFCSPEASAPMILKLLGIEESEEK